MATNMAALGHAQLETDCKSENDLLRWLTDIRQRHTPSPTTVNCAGNNSKCLVPELMHCLHHSSRFVCFAASAALRCVLHTLKQDDLRKTMEELLVMHPSREAAQRTLPLAQQLQIETVVSFMKEAKVDLQTLQWSALVQQWKLCVLECYSCPYLLVPTLTLTKRMWKSDQSGTYKHTIASHTELIVGLCKHCSQNVEVKKLLRICQYFLRWASGSEEGGEECLRLVMERVLCSEVLTRRLACWVEQCVSPDLSSVPVLQPLPRDCSDDELLPAVVRRSFLLVLQGAASLLALEEGRQKGLAAELEQTSRLVETAVSGWRGRHNDSVPAHMEVGKVLLYLISEDDSVLMEALLLCTQIHIRLNHTGTQHHCPGSLVLLLSAADPHHLFVGFMDSVAFDHSTLLEFIASEDVRFVSFFTAYLQYTVATWDQFVHVCQQHNDTVTSVLVPCDSSSEDDDTESCGSGDREGETDSNLQQSKLELDAGMNVVTGTEGSPSPKRVCADAMLEHTCSSLDGDRSPLPVNPQPAANNVSCAVLEAVMQCFTQLHLALRNMAAKGLIQDTQTVCGLLRGVLECFTVSQSD